jgi:hypothetical protein
VLTEHVVDDGRCVVLAFTLGQTLLETLLFRVARGRRRARGSCCLGRHVVDDGHVAVAVNVVYVAQKAK